MKEKLHSYIESLTKGKLSHIEKNLLKDHPELHKFVLASWDLEKEAKFIEKCHYAIYHETDHCPYGKKKRFESFRMGFVGCGKFRECRCAREKYEQSMMETHGVTSPLKSKKILAKAETTWEKRYGVSKLGQINLEQKKNSCRERYGFDVAASSPEIHEKVKKTNLKNMGFAYPFCNPFIQTTIQEHWQKLNGKKSFIRTKVHGLEASRKYAEENFSGNWEILFDRDLFEAELKIKSRGEIAKELGCSLPLIDKKIASFDLVEFVGKQTTYELLIAEFLKSNNIQYRRNDRKTIAPKELDFFIPLHNLAIEFHGLYWHGERGGKGRNYHMEKYQKCKEKGIHLIQIFEDEWNENGELVRNIIMTKLGLVTKVIGARKCTVREIDSTTANKFLKNYHLQGVGNGSHVKYGLYHDETLVSVMTFSRHEIWELKRYAVLPGVRIQGGASKLFSKFVKDHSPTKVFTFSDNRYFTGGTYKALGFHFVHETSPGYSWSDSKKRFHRLNFTKKRLVVNGHDASMTETEIMKENGYDRIWDCGNKKWIWEA